MPITRFQDLIAWQKARVLTAEIYRLTDDGRLGKDWGLRDQMRRAAVSVMANVAEGFERKTPAQFSYFLTIAKGSCAELQSHIIVAYDVKYIDPATYRALLSNAEEVSRIVGGLLRREEQKVAQSQS